MVERITPTIETITVNDKDYILKLYAKINIEGIQKIVVGFKKEIVLMQIGVG